MAFDRGGQESERGVRHGGSHAERARIRLRRHEGQRDGRHHGGQAERPRTQTRLGRHEDNLPIVMPAATQNWCVLKHASASLEDNEEVASSAMEDVLK